MTRSLKTLALVAATAAGTLAAGVAHARSDVYWSIDISAPGYPVGVGVNLSNAPRVVAYPAPVVVAPPRGVYGPPQVVYAPPPVVYAPHPVYVAAPPVFYGPPVYVVNRKRWKGPRGPQPHPYAQMHRHVHGYGHGR